MSANLSVKRGSEKKMDVVKVPKRSSIKPILVYIGDFDPDEEAEIKKYFYKMIYFGDLLKNDSK